MRIRHKDDASVALRATHMRKTNAGVAGRSFDNGTSRFQSYVHQTSIESLAVVSSPSHFLSSLDNPECCTILHAPSRVLELRFTKNFASSTLRETLYADLDGPCKLDR